MLLRLFLCFTAMCSVLTANLSADADCNCSTGNDCHCQHHENDLIIALDETNFDETISSGLTLVTFSADWCGYCKKMAPTLEELARDFEGKALFAKVNFSDSRNLATQFNVTGIPVMILFKDGIEVGRIVGYTAKENLSNMISVFVTSQ